MSILVVVDAHGGAIDEQARRTVSAALAIGGDVDMLLAGSGIAGAVSDAAGVAGVRMILCADDPCYAHHLAEPCADLIVSLSDSYDAILMTANAAGKNMMPRVAALLDVMQISDIVAVEASDCFVRPIYAGNGMQKLRSHDTKKIITVRATAFPVVGDGGAAEVRTVSGPANPALSHFHEEKLTRSTRPDLTAAKIVVSGGRALGSAENFATYIDPVADALGAAVGASRAAVDAGYVPNNCQVGQTGQIVAPELYIAAGISGAIQHIAGMKDSRIIVAINKDEDAPIFQIADYGLVDDLFTALPELTAALA